jgi:hypothetical protein
MKTPSRLVLALLALASCAATAQTIYSGQADQERRERNREEALANYREHHETTAGDTMSDRHERERAREKTHNVAQKTRHEAHEVADSTRRVTHKSANAVRRAGHKTAVKARDITARADAKFGPRVNTPRRAGEASTRVTEPPVSAPPMK